MYSTNVPQWIIFSFAGRYPRWDAKFTRYLSNKWICRSFEQTFIGIWDSQSKVKMPITTMSDGLRTLCADVLLLLKNAPGPNCCCYSSSEFTSFWRAMVSPSCKQFCAPISLYLIYHHHSIIWFGPLFWTRHTLYSVVCLGIRTLSFLYK